MHEPTTSTTSFFSPPKAPPISAPVPMFTLAIPQSDPATDEMLCFS
jgi:hypothetical protein